MRTNVAGRRQSSNGSRSHVVQFPTRTIVAVSSCVVPAAAAAAVPLGTSFTYQGRLENAGAALNGAADFSFSLFDAAFGPGRGFFN